jgi:polysaccharide pyruvyl transferase WcaK-like protein
MGRALDGLVDEFPEAEIHLLPLRSWPDHYVRTDDDYVCSLEVAHAARHGAQAITHRTVESVSELAKVSRSLGLLIGTRLHSLVVAAANDVPIIAISYDSKVDGFMRAIGQQDSVMTVADLSPSRITARSRQLLQDPVNQQQTLSSGLASYRGHSQGLVLAIKGVLGTIG